MGCFARSSLTGAALVAIALIAAVALAAPGDMDDDGIPDELDNCIIMPNGPLEGPIPVTHPSYVPQLDSDEDGYGNICDCDFNNDGGCGLDDISYLLNSIGSGAPGHGELDMNGDGAPGLDDLTIHMPTWGQAPGPSGLPCAAANLKGSCPPN